MAKKVELFNLLDELYKSITTLCPMKIKLDTIVNYTGPIMTI
jgi:hypothetical protein